MILLTGATGTVGGALLHELAKLNAPVRVLVRDPRKLGAAASSAQIAIGDLDDPESLAAAMYGVERAFLITFDDRHDRNALEAAARCGVRHIVKQSTIEAQHDPIFGPAKWHRAREQMIERSGLEWTFIRPTMMMSNTVGWWSHSIRSEQVVYFPGGEGRVAPVDPADVAALAAKCLTTDGHTGQIYPVTGPQLLSIRDMVEVIAAVLGQPLDYVDVPEAAVSAGMEQSGLSQEVVQALLETLRGIREGKFEYIADQSPIIGRPLNTFAAWARANLERFAGPGRRSREAAEAAVA